MTPLLALAAISIAVAVTSFVSGILGMSEKDFRTWTRRTVSVIGVFYLCNGAWALAHA